MQKFMTLSQAKAKLNGLVDEVAEQASEFVITRKGLPVAALVPMEVYDGWIETVAIMSNKEMMTGIHEAIRSMEAGEKWSSFEDVFGEPL